MTAPWPRNAQSKNTVLSRGQSVGGVSGRAGAKAGGSNLSANDSFACRGGRRHPGSQEGGSLRGASSERRPRSVRSSVAVPPSQASAPMTAGVRRSPRRGTPSACATKRMHPSQAREIVASEQGTRPSLGPSTRARQSSLCSAGESLGGEAVEVASRKGKLGSPRRTFTGAVTNGRSAARRVSPLSQGRQRDAMKKRKEIEVSVPARIQELGFGCPHVVVQLQKSVGDVWPRISSANALQKERSGSSERGPSSERKSAGETVGGRVERRDESRVGLTAQVGRGSAQDPG